MNCPQKVRQHFAAKHKNETMPNLEAMIRAACTYPERKSDIEPDNTKPKPGKRSQSSERKVSFRSRKSRRIASNFVPLPHCLPKKWHFNLSNNSMNFSDINSLKEGHRIDVYDHNAHWWVQKVVTPVQKVDSFTDAKIKSVYEEIEIGVAESKLGDLLWKRRNSQSSFPILNLTINSKKKEIFKRSIKQAETNEHIVMAQLGVILLGEDFGKLSPKTWVSDGIIDFSQDVC